MSKLMYDIVPARKISWTRSIFFVRCSVINSMLDNFRESSSNIQQVICEAIILEYTTHRRKRTSQPFLKQKKQLADFHMAMSVAVVLAPYDIRTATKGEHFCAKSIIWRAQVSPNQTC